MHEHLFVSKLNRNTVTWFINSLITIYRYDGIDIQDGYEPYARPESNMGFIDDRYGGAVDQYGRPVQIQQQYGMYPNGHDEDDEYDFGYGYDPRWWILLIFFYNVHDEYSLIFMDVHDEYSLIFLWCTWWIFIKLSMDVHIEYSLLFFYYVHDECSLIF